MKILQVIHGFLPTSTGGTEVYTYNLSTELSKKHSVSIFYRVSDFKDEEYALRQKRWDALDLCEFNNTFRNYDSFEATYRNSAVAQRFGIVLDRLQPDVIHIQHLLYLSTLIIDEASQRNIPIIFTLHDYWLVCPQGQLLKNNESVCEQINDSWCSDCVLYQLGIIKNIFNIYYALTKWIPDSLVQVAKKAYLTFGQKTFLNETKTSNFLKKRMEHMKSICSRIDRFIAPSCFIKRKFIDFGIPEDKILLRTLGLEKSDFYHAKKHPSPKLRFGFIGNLMPAKGVHTLIECFNAIKNTEIELKIFGQAQSYKSILGSYLKHIKKLAAKNQTIKFMGGFNHEQIIEIFNEIDVLIVPSIWHENSPLVIQEAFMAETPVIAANIGGIPEFVKDGVNGLLFNPADPIDLRKKIEYILENPLILDEFKKNIPEVKSIEENAQEIEEVYANLIFKNNACFKYAQ